MRSNGKKNCKNEIKKRIDSSQEEQDLAANNQRKELKRNRQCPIARERAKIGNSEIDSDEQSHFLNLCSVSCDKEKENNPICGEEGTAKKEACVKRSPKRDKFKSHNVENVTQEMIDQLI